jgi:competence protein ComEC
VSLAARFKQLAPPEVVPFVCAVWLGDRGGISQDEYQSYIETGTAHILSVSGVHIGILFFSASMLLALFLAPGRLRALLTMAIVVGFVLLSGASPPSVRSGIMIALFVAAELFGREPDAASALGAAAILQLGWNPDLLFDTGFQLTFLSVASLLLFHERFERRLRRIPRLVRGMVSTSLAVQLLPLPVAIMTFHVFTFVAPVANLIVVPLLTAVLWLCFAFSLTALWSPFLGEIFGHALLPLVIAIRDTAAWTRTAMHLPTPTWIAVICYWGAIAVVYYLLGPAVRRRQWLVPLAVLSAGVLIFWKPWFSEPEVVILDVGHGSAAFVQAADGSTALIDAGDHQDQLDYGERVIAPFVWARGLTRLDYLIVSHPDRDHIGGAAYLVTHLDVGDVVLGRDSGQPLEAELVGLCAQRGIPVRRVVRGDALGLGDARFTVLHPPSDWPSSASDNDSGVVVRLDWEGRRLLFPGDIELAGERAVAQTDCRADVLIVPHHGSKTSSSPAFIHAIDPRFALVSTGGASSREGAAEFILERYRAEGIHIWRTDYSGGIRITPGAKDLAIQGTREARGYRNPENSRDVSAP